MLKFVRRIIALLSIVAVTLLFLDFTGTAVKLWPWMAKIQFVPAVLSANILIVAILIIATLIFGRIYCSIICPMGIFQDVVSWLRGATMKKKSRMKRFKWEKAHTKLRLGVLTVFVLLVILGLVHALAASIAGLIEPYSAYGRIATQIMAPAYDGVNNLLASWSESQPDNYMFYRVVYALNIPLLSVAIVTLLVVVFFAWRGGRDYCNMICPVGTILGYLSKLSLFKITIDTNKCITCGKCSRKCKAKCINSKGHEIDYSRCVVCFDCIDSCSEGALKYKLIVNKKSKAAVDVVASDDKNVEDPGRRGFVAGMGFIAGATAMHVLAKDGDGGLTNIKPKLSKKRAVRIVPPGSKGLVHMSQHCTACQLCISSCPSHILKPTISFDGFMQPSIDYIDGYCTVGCTTCSDVCPAGAIEHITPEEKTAIKIGNALVDLDTCISVKGEKCGNCARHCPTGAARMVPVNEDDPQGALKPIVNAEACIGCGYCEYYCPVGTVDGMKGDGSAIYVVGIERHRDI